jgi:twitching motility two-component system response regulator PilH
VNVLIVDDEAESLRIAADALADDGLVVHKAMSVREAIDLLQRNGGADLILCDIMMPNESGFELQRYLANNLRFSEIPVIICSGHADALTVALGIRLGARDFVVKPYKRETLAGKVQHVLESGKGAVLVALADTPRAVALVASLCREGYRAQAVTPAADGIYRLPEVRFDVLITERDLSGQSGLDLMIAAKERSPHLPVYFLESYPTAYLEQRLVASGANGVIREPFSGREIGIKLENHRRIKRNTALKEIEFIAKLRKRPAESLNLGSVPSKTQP